MLVVGIDPAPSKAAVEWSDDGPRTTRADELVARLDDLARRGDVLVAWDAPLAYDSVSHSDRAADRAVRAWVKRQATRRIAPKAASVLPFSQCPHWAITCAAIGLPFRSDGGQERPTWKLVARPEAVAGPSIIEVHPAVAIAVLWVDRDVSGAMPVYKRPKELAARCRIASALDFPAACTQTDDLLDAYVAYHVASAFLRGAASWVGDPERGGYVLPNGASADEMRAAIRAC